ncbi:hypothetical protein HMI49_14230 [Corallococcus exercitus]|uniref:WD40 repeat domain-containing protein n=1 Tax=Corallococcus exercitus TaxID=2316736 RepID=A0A7Y4NSV7_9BACT|nr:hypothetical protein [Corallococcus exercitus]NOK34357.1 hypothetical protein [Corallococcus exercitus]
MTLARDARLLKVDEGQHVLLSARADGTYAQGLPEGEPVRIAGAVEGIDITADGQSTVMWSPEVDGVRTVWLWRFGTPEAIVLSQQSRGAVLHDAAQTFVAFLERDGAGASSVQVARTAACAPGNCVLQTLLQVQDGTPVLERGGTVLSLVKGARRWLIDVPSGAVTDLGELPGFSVLSPGGTRYAWAEDARVRVFDTVTGAQVWEDDIPHDGYRDWKTTHAFMLNETRVDVGAQGVYTNWPIGAPVQHFLHSCQEQGCSETVKAGIYTPYTLQDQFVMYCRPDFCQEIRCSQPSPSFLTADGVYLYSTQNPETLYGPVLGQGFADMVWLKGSKGQLHRLEWQRGDQVWTLKLDAPYPSAPIHFIPGRQQVVFHQPVSREDGTPESHLWTWSRFSRADLGTLEGTPGPGSLVRANPPTLYMDVDTVNADGTSARSIIRVAL